jgi:hypothetical protein
MIVFLIEGLTGFVLAALGMIGSFALLIIAVSLLPIFGMFGIALYEGFEILHERHVPERRTREKALPLTRSFGRPVLHH